MTKRRALIATLVLAFIAAFAALKPDAPLRLAWREWTVVSMTGFASKPIPGASFRFFGDEIRLSDGANSMRFKIDWRGDGFRVEEVLISTAVGLPEGTSTFADLFEVGQAVAVNRGWQEVTLSHSGMVVVARA